MLTDFFGICIIYLVTLLLAFPLGKYIASVYAFRSSWHDRIFQPLESFIYSLSGIDPKAEMTWKQHLKALLWLNLVWFFWSLLILTNQGWLPLNPDKNPSMSPDLAFNTAISFLVNCNLQHYSGETGMSYLGQIACLMFLQFVTAGTGMAACAAVFNAMREQTSTTLGNFYVYFLRSCTRILLPISFVAALGLAMEGVPMHFEGKATQINLSGDTIQVSRGPAAAMVAIKQAGTNGGGYFGVNSAHPLENPTYLTNLIENVLILLIPIALVFALGYYLNRKRLAWMV
ncbi:MAG TPA: potassium-transporting ATPase subunit KdpA, partial [Microscillaceae bacterium]|nr:potassium-transporting ATPase subunit KdpA [Microscillaceae bacterium]